MEAGLDMRLVLVVSGGGRDSSQGRGMHELFEPRAMAVDIRDGTVELTKRAQLHSVRPRLQISLRRAHQHAFRISPTILDI